MLNSKIQAGTKEDSELQPIDIPSSHNNAKPIVGRSAEYILCSAIWFDDGITTYIHQPKNIKSGFVVCGRRHHNCFTIKAMLQGVGRTNYINEVQGFLTNKDRFVDRQEAMIIAVLANQIIERTGSRPDTLYSEDVW